MKPRTKLQRRIVAASGRLPEITPAQLHWGYAHLLPHEAFRTKRGKITCTECRHTWQGDQQIDRAVCPHCGVRLTVVTTRRRTSWNKAYLSVVTTRKGLQVVRYFLLERQGRTTRTLRMLRGHAALDYARRKNRYRSTHAQYVLLFLRCVALRYAAGAAVGMLVLQPHIRRTELPSLPPYPRIAKDGTSLRPLCGESCRYLPIYLQSAPCGNAA
jgi:DNA-directed RNA polymerase subunit RPC12/RpoP